MVEHKYDDGRLQHVQNLQFSHRSNAENLMLELVKEVYADDVVSVELRPSPVSLNSIHGFLNHADGRRFFFKTHTESDTVIAEYYRAQLIADAGYPIIQPIFQSNAVGKQLLVYEQIADPSVFDVAWMIEDDPSELARLLNQLSLAQHREDDALFQRYLQSLHWQAAEAAARAPIHQLFHHRLTGGRYQRFYPDHVELSLPNETLTFEELRQHQWHINGQEYEDTLSDIISRCLELLHPSQAGPAIIGHGDAHNGNVFLQSKPSPSLLYFDPAFAGSHHPLLDLAKPLFHNVFAMWMYFPQEMRSRLKIRCCREDNRWFITYISSLPATREMFFHSKLNNVLLPILRELFHRNWLRKDWRAFLKAALALCPLLTMNLADRKRFPPQIAILGFAMTIEMGAESQNTRSIIDQTLDDVEVWLSE